MKTINKVLIIMAGIVLLMTCSKSDDLLNNDLPENELKKAAVKGHFDYIFDHAYMPCVGEEVSGVWPTDFILTNHNYILLASAKGYLTGETTGNIYECNQPLVSHTNNDGVETIVTSTSQVWLDKKLIAILHWTYHLKVDENGEIIVTNENVFEGCK
jgi:hypothetical protein